MNETPLHVLYREAGEPGAIQALDRLAGALAGQAQWLAGALAGQAQGLAGALAGQAQGLAGARAGQVHPSGEMLSLMPLAYRPRLLVRLDERSRSAGWRLTARRWHAGEWVLEAEPGDQWHGVLDLVTDFDRDPDGAGQIAVAFAATDRDGRRRERAVAEMAGRRRPEHLAFLVLRCDDWAGQVRERAGAAVAAMLRERPEHLLRAALPMAAHLAARRRGGKALRIIERMVEEDFDRYAPILLGDRDLYGRRLAFGVGRRLERWTYSDLVDFAIREPDRMVRLEAARTAVREAVRREDLAVLRDLAKVRFVAVRSLALAALSELGHDDEVAVAITDPAPLIRAYARSRAIDPATRYRSLIAPAALGDRAAEPVAAGSAAESAAAAAAAEAVAAEAVGVQAVAAQAVAAGSAAADAVCWAIVGLAEMGDRRDAGLLAPLLRHPDHRIRAAAVRGLRLIDSVPVEETLPLLTDPARDVVREASLALGIYRRRIPEGLPWTLLADPRPEVRLAGSRLLANRAPIVRLAAALTLAADTDPVLAHRGRMAAIRLIPALSTAPPGPGPDARQTLLELLERARPALGRHYDRMSAAVAGHDR